MCFTSTLFSWTAVLCHELYYLSNPAHILTWIAPHFPNAQGFTEMWKPQKSKVREVCASRSAHRRFERVISSHRERWASSWPCLRLIGNTSITPDGSSPLTALPNRSDIFRIAFIYQYSPIFTYCLLMSGRLDKCLFMFLS
jgi:hypothetical protein